MRAEIEGTVEIMRGSPGCACCDGPHIHHRRVKLDDFAGPIGCPPVHDVRRWLEHFALPLEQLDGRRVRVTVELLETTNRRPPKTGS